jgi:PPOX class probable F420-dependent enzyme
VSAPPGEPLAYHRAMTDTLTRPTPSMSDRVRSFLEAPNFASIATLDPDGAPRQAVVWYLFDEGDLVVNSRVGRRWPANLQREPRIAISVVDPEDGMRWVGITGTVETVLDQPRAQADIAAMARRYERHDPAKAEAIIADRFEREERISFRVRIETVHDHLA